MASENQNMSLKWNTTRRNLVIQGLQGQTNDEMMSNVIKVAMTIGIIMYKEDIEAVLRLKNRDETLGPVVVTLKRISQRNKFFQKKINLRNIESMANIFVNADESIDVWRNKVLEIEFCYLDNDIPVKDADVPYYLNNYFATIATPNRIFDFNSVSKNEYEKSVATEFNFEPPNIF